MQLGIRELALTWFSGSTSNYTICNIFYNSIVTKFVGSIYHFVAVYSILKALPLQYSKMVLQTILATNIVKIIVNITWFAIKNHVFQVSRNDMLESRGLGFL